MDPIISQQPEQLPTQPHKHFLNKKFAITLVILLLLGTGAYAGIWYWGNQQQSGVYTFEECVKAKDSKMLETYPEQCVTSDGKTFPNPDQTASEPPVSGNVPADWKTYTNTQYGFEFKYPADFHINEGIDYKCTDQNCLNVVITNGTRSYGILINSPELKRKSSVTEQVFYNGIKITKSPYDKGTLYEFSNGKNLFIIATVSDSDYFYNQILSTFKFTISNPSQTACTQEAKLCPDGSAVGRAGPNCEFAACPK